jgi:acetoin utilization protein AcuB
MTVLPFTVRPGMPVLNAMRWMRQRRIRHLLVVEDGRLVGIVTDRDVRLRLPSPAGPLSVWELTTLLAELTVGEVMTKTVIAVDAECNATDAAATMLAHRIGALPVMYGGQLVGIVTETDFVRTFVTAPAA